jgi:ribosomal protein L11 methyltransferase
MKWWQASCTVPWEAAEAVAAVLHEWPEIQGVTLEGGPREPVKNPEFGEWMDELLTDSDTTEITVYVPEHVSREEVERRFVDSLDRVRAAGVSVGDAFDTVRIEAVDESSWENAWKEDFQPIPVGNKLVVVPKWWVDDFDPGDRIPIVLEPGMAFGTGTHATTQLCLEALETIPLAGASVLDVGCGTAILSIAAGKLGASRVLGIDIDPVAVKAAEANVADNGETERIRIVQGDLLSPSLESGYDVLVANILRDILIRMMPQAAEKLKPGGSILLSGFVTEQEDAIRQSMSQCGFEVERRLCKEDWVALVGRKAQ